MISTLIALVLALLVQVQQPNVPVAIKIQALELANTALSLAAQEASSTPTVADLQASSTPQDAAPTIVINIPPTPPPAPAPAPVAPPPAEVAAAPVVPSPTCTFGATLAHWSQGTNHALFAWTFTDGATAEIDVNGAKDTSLLYGPGRIGAITSSGSVHQPDLYGESVFASTTYTMVVSNQGGAATCSAAI